MTRRLRVGIVGTGFMGAVHARAAQRAGAELVAVATRSGGDAAAARMGAARTVPAVEDLLGEVDVVHVCTPNHLHEQQARSCAGSGHARRLREAPRDRRRCCRAADPAGRRARAGRRRCRSSTASTAPFARCVAAPGPPWTRYVRSAAATCRTGSPAMTTPTGASTRPSGARPARSATSACTGCDLAEFVTGHRITRLAATTRVAVPEARRWRRAHRHRGSRGHPVRDRPRRHRRRRGQPGLARAQEPARVLDVDAAEAAWSF